MNFKKHKNKIIGMLATILILAGAFWYGGSAPGLQGWSVNPPEENTQQVASEQDEKTENEEQEDTEKQEDDEEQEKEAEEETADADKESSEDNAEKEEAQEDVTEFSEVESEETTNVSSESNTTTSKKQPSASTQKLSAEEKVAQAKEISGGKSSPGVAEGSVEYSGKSGMKIDPATGKDKYQTDPVPEGRPIPVEPEESVVTDKQGTATLSVRADTILDNMEWLDPNKVELVPEDGVIYQRRQVAFYEGESVFDVLQREMRNAGIHMEASFTPMYNSAYVEGINNLYEFDVGELSGWMYKVNGWFPNYGASRYQVKKGDVIEWVYTTNLGVDVGGYYSVGD
jgi:hypothetical protein